ncbi:autotransporter outer membrane beta-barrel domain-containing protein [Stenotrophomonas sp.]|uniref:autotransporter family protein n=1 Tax=Stenotrophomonas sp. TaxID=69392 RepID=UPI0028ADD058|nr:autotransporter outer membrane beta-barrel domain-containing protein [Stenotrophomonas sp.]
MRPLSQCSQRCALFSAIALSLATLPLQVSAGTVTGPGNTHTLNPGDPTELWDVTDQAELIIAPGGATSGIQVDNATVTGNGALLGGLFGIRLANTSTGTLTGGSITITSAAGDAGVVASGSTLDIDGMTITSAGRGFSSTGAGSALTLRNSSIATGGEALELGDGASLVLDNVQASSDGSSGAGIALDISGGTAQVSNSTLTGSASGVTMTGGTLLLADSQVQSTGTAMTLAGSASAQPTASVTGAGSLISGAIGASVTNGSTLNVAGATVRGTGTGTSGGTGAGVSMTNGNLVLSQGARVEGTRHGIYFTGSAAGNNSIQIDASSVTASDGPAINAPLAGNADITVSNGSSLVGGNGVALQVGANAAVNLDVTGSSISGDIVGATLGTNTATVNVTLGGGAQLQGAIINGTNVALSDASWQLTADSNVQQLDVGSGAVVQFGDGSAFHTLQVAGNYSGDGGTLRFNTVLAGDDASSDRLVIDGDSSGQTNVEVNNVGGPGALTSRGIQLVQVGGASNGQFDLIGRAVGGQYEYFLFKDAGDGDWYLRSELPVQPDPCDIDPTLPECQEPEPDPCEIDPSLPECEGPVVPVLRPEPGAYLANLQAANGMFRLGYHHRQAGQNSGRAWARVDGSRSGFGANLQQLNVRGSSQALSVGTQLFGNEHGSGVGVMLGSGNASSTSTSVLTGYYARGKVKGNALGLYGTWRGVGSDDPYAGLYVDGSVHRAVFRNEVEGNALATERYDSKAWQGAVEVGYAVTVRQSGNSRVFLEPQLQVGYTRWDDVRHVERNGTLVHTADASGAFGRVGVRLSGVTRWGGSAAEVQPYLAANWLRNGSNPYVRMDDEAVDARIPRQRGEFSAGASVRFPGGFGAWAGLSLQQGSGYHQRSAQLGLSYRW